MNDLRLQIPWKIFEKYRLRTKDDDSDLIKIPFIGGGGECLFASKMSLPAPLNTRGVDVYLVVTPSDWKETRLAVVGQEIIDDPKLLRQEGVPFIKSTGQDHPFLEIYAGESVVESDPFGVNWHLFQDGFTDHSVEHLASLLILSELCSLLVAAEAAKNA